MYLFFSLVGLFSYSLARYLYYANAGLSGKSDVGSDGYYSLILRRAMKESKRFFINDFPNSFPKMVNIYRPLGPYILSYFSEKRIRQHFGLINSAIDFFYLATVLILFYCIDGAQTGSYVAAMLIVLIFTFLPSKWGGNPANNMNFRLSWRVLGNFLVALYYLNILFFEYYAPQGYLSFTIFSISIILYVLVYYGSIFGLQAIIFGTPIYGILSGTFYPILLLGVGHLAVYLLNRSEARRFILGKMTHFKYLKSVFTQSRSLSNLGYELSIISFLKGKISISSIKLLIKRNVFVRGIILFISQPAIILCLKYIGDEFSIILINLYLTGFILFLITLLPQLKVIGVADRYLEFISYFSLIVGLGHVALNIHLLPDWLMLLLTCLLMVQIFHGLRLCTKGLRNKTDGLEYHYPTHLKEILKNTKVFPISFSEAWRISYLFDCQVLYPPLSDDYSTSMLLASNYPLPDFSSVEDFCYQFSIDYILINKEEIIENRIETIDVMATLGQIMHEDPKCVLIKFEYAISR